MRVLDGIEAIRDDVAGGVISVGNFDGVHVGHQRILRRGAEIAAAEKVPLVAMTFDPHPLAVLHPDRAPKLLTPADERLAQLERCGPDAVIVIRTDAAFLRIAADEFAARILVERLRIRHIVEGPTFRYGRDHAGTIDTLRAAGRRHGFGVHVVEPVQLETRPGPQYIVSSSLVRRALADGQPELAARALGRPYALIGPVIQGRQRGATLGYPTANLDPRDQLVPRDGVYAGRATVGDATYTAAVSIGRAPTFENDAQLIEAFLLDYSGDLYGETMRLELLAWLREQERFDSAEALAARIRDDVEQVRRLATGD